MKKCLCFAYEPFLMLNGQEIKRFFVIQITCFTPTSCTSRGPFSNIRMMTRLLLHTRPNVFDTKFCRLIKIVFLPEDAQESHHRL